MNSSGNLVSSNKPLGNLVPLEDRQQVVLSLVSDITRPVEVNIQFIQSEHAVVKRM